MGHAAPLPTEQHPYEGLETLSVAELHARRERVYLVLAGLFLGTLTMLNILGISHFIDLSFTVFGVKVPVPLAVGVLPYPLTFLCTDFICELYGRRRANEVVMMGLLLNAWVVFIVWLGGVLPSATPPGESVFMRIRTLTFGAVTASMIAYLVAQLVDVQLFHFWKALTKGKHLWLRNNGSTMVSQMVDTVAVILITYMVGALPMHGEASVAAQLLAFIAAGYVFKLLAALLDTLPFYVGVYRLSKYLRLTPPGQAASLEVPAPG